jgi:hypothetical protein
MAAMRSAFRPLPLLLLALVAWGAMAPLVAVTCVPAAPCAGLMELCPLAGAKRAAQPVVGAPDCCEQSARETAPATILGGTLQLPAASEAPAVMAVIPAATRDLWRWLPAEQPAASPVPLYTLHSILLI